MWCNGFDNKALKIAPALSEELINGAVTLTLQFRDTEY